MRGAVTVVLIWCADKALWVADRCKAMAGYLVANDLNRRSSRQTKGDGK